MMGRPVSGNPARQGLKPITYLLGTTPLRQEVSTLELARALHSLRETPGFLDSLRVGLYIKGRPTPSGLAC